jgi:hypothetical protein
MQHRDFDNESEKQSSSQENRPFQGMKDDKTSHMIKCDNIKQTTIGDF